MGEEGRDMSMKIPRKWEWLNKIPERDMTPTARRLRRDLTADERRLLVHKPEAREEIEKGMSKVELRRLDKTTEKEEELERRFMGKVTTRQDVMGIIELYNKSKILPLAVRLDAAEAALRYLTAPWWRRRWWDLKRIADDLLGWLERKGIKFYTLNEEAPDGEVSQEAGGD